MLALNKIWDLRFTREQLLTLGLQLGADVPVFLHGKACFAEGVGEHMQDCFPPEDWYLIIVPKVHVNTGKIFSDPALTRNSKTIRIRAPLNWDQLGGFRNDCEALVRSLYPEIDEIIKWLSNYGLARMTGTGSCVFSPFKSESEARKIAALIPDGYDYFVARATNRSGGMCPK